MSEENKPLTEAEDEANDHSPDSQPPKRPEYTKAQRLMALFFAILVVIITLMYTYSIATGDLFRR